jgi:hypothetical protein
MKQISWIVAVLFVAATAAGQTAGVTVALTAAPQGSTGSVSGVGSPVVLTATVRTPGPAVQPIGGGGTTYDRNLLRFTFKAVRSFPCPNAFPIRENGTATGGSSGRDSLVTETHISEYTWIPQAVQSGEYTFSVEVMYSQARPSGQPTLKPQVIGTASTSMYMVTPPPGSPGNTILSAVPPSGSTVTFPVSVTLSASVPNPTDQTPSKWRFTFECRGGAPPKSAPPIETPYASASWMTSVDRPGKHDLYVTVDKVRLSDCYWQYRHLVYNLNYYLNAQ